MNEQRPSLMHKKWGLLCLHREGGREALIARPGEVDLLRTLLAPLLGANAASAAAEGLLLRYGDLPSVIAAGASARVYSVPELSADALAMLQVLQDVVQKLRDLPAVGSKRRLGTQAT